MALIRCPNCDTLHDLDDAFLASGRRKVRCASCRTVFEAEEPESDSTVTIAMPLPQSSAPKGGAALSRDVSVGEAPDAMMAAMDEAARDDGAAPEPVADAAEEDPFAAAMEADAAAAGGADAGADISADELEALFADAAPAADEQAAPAAAEDATDIAEPREFDPESLARAQDAAVTAALSEAPPAGERRARRAGGEARRAEPPPSRLARTGVMAAMVMAAGIGTVSALMLLREEAVRLFPASAKAFETVGLSTAARGLDISEVQSQMVSEAGRETLEVSARIVNNGKSARKLPVLRLAIRGSAGNELYVWTSNADVTELGPGESTRVLRRLASPPAESHSVMVRFVAKDDIVAAIR